MLRAGESLSGKRNELQLFTLLTVNACALWTAVFGARRQADFSVDRESGACHGARFQNDLASVCTC